MYQSLNIESSTSSQEENYSRADEVGSNPEKRRMKSLAMGLMVVLLLVVLALSSSSSPSSRQWKKMNEENDEPLVGNSHHQEYLSAREEKNAKMGIRQSFGVVGGDEEDEENANEIEIVSDASCPQSTNRPWVTPWRARVFALNVPAGVTSMTIDLCGSSVDTVIQILNAQRRSLGVCDDAHPQIGCTSCGINGRRENWRLDNVQAGTYTIRVWAYSASGRAVLRVRCRGTQPSGTTSTTTTTTTTTELPPPPPTTSTTTTSTTTTTTTTTRPPNGCPRPRVRRPWEDIPQSERDLYVEGYRALRTNGKLSVFANVHNDLFSVAHGPASAFLPWHRYFLFELEEQIRALPDPKFRCFTLPYWDYFRGGDVDTPVRDLAMWTQGLGGDGDAQTGCVTSDGWNSYVDSRGACLRRGLATFDPFGPTKTSITGLIVPDLEFSTFHSRLEGGVGYHNTAHGAVASTRSGQVGGGRSPDDPAFFLIHANVDMWWALRQDCHTNRENEPGYPNPNGIMQFGELATQTWSTSQISTVTPAQVFDSVGFLGVNYDASAVLSRARAEPNPIQLSSCSFDQLIRPDGYDNRPKQTVEEAEHNAYKACVSTPGMCKYIEMLETCGSKRKYAKLSLEMLLNKKGVKGNACIERQRKITFPIAKMLGDLDEVCAGESDKVCVRPKNYYDGDE